MFITVFPGVCNVSIVYMYRIPIPTMYIKYKAVTFMFLKIITLLNLNQKLFIPC